MKAYKLLRIKKDGKLYPLFINKTKETPIGVWMQAECHPTKGFAVRTGWHCTMLPKAPHLSMKLASGEQRVWCEVDIEDYEFYDRPILQGGTWALAQRMKIIKILTSKEVNAVLNITKQEV